MKRRAVVLLSGGLDSTTCLAWGLDRGFECYTLAVDYGQRHRKELECARLVAHALGAVRHTIVTVDLRAVGGSALTDTLEVPKDRSVAVICGTGYRASIAASFLKSQGYHDVANVLGGMSAWQGTGLTSSPSPR